ncbi:MAG: CDP-alcohol phosphatidyltransferase family protein [Candidatus Thorarchaeota archaeon]
MSPSKYRVRGIFRGSVMRVARPLIRAGVHPNTVTYTSLLFSFLAFLLLTLIQLQPLFGLMAFLVGFFDGVDGAVAKGGSISTSSGAFKDSVIDKITEAILLLSIAVTYENTVLFGIPISVWAFICLTGWILTSYTRSRAETLGARDLDIGVGGRSERLLTLVIFSLLNLIIWGLVVVTIMGLLTAGYRFYHYNAQISSQSNSSESSD